MIEIFALFFKKGNNVSRFLLLLPSFRQVLKVSKLSDWHCRFLAVQFCN
jgi:hypothetical protein